MSSSDGSYNPFRPPIRAWRGRRPPRTRLARRGFRTATGIVSPCSRCRSFRPCRVVIEVSGAEQDDMTRIDVVAAAFAAGGRGAKLDLIRVQKLLFLIDRVVSERIGGPFFAFRPYLFGPFDQAVYDAIRDLAADDRARTDARRDLIPITFSPKTDTIMARRCSARFRRPSPTTSSGRPSGFFWCRIGRCSRLSITSIRRWRRRA